MPVPSRGPGRSIRPKAVKVAGGSRSSGAGKSAISVKPRGMSTRVRAPGTKISLINRS